MQRPPRERCLAFQRPQLLKEWHPTKNGDSTPQDFFTFSNKSVWWFCPEGHEWKSPISSRSGGTGCPYCSGNKVCSDNSLAARHPDLVAEWHREKNHPLSPADVTPGTDKKAWWVCSKGHEWQACIGDRTRGSGCPYCSGNKVGTDNNLNVVNPSLAKQWHRTKNGSLLPSDVTPGSTKKVWWQCEKGHEWKATVGGRSRGTNCPRCNNTKTSRPELRLYAELAGLIGRVEHRQQVEGKELDVYLPDYRMGIEYDGFYYHKSLRDHDLSKSRHFREHGIRLIRFRQAPLSELSKKDIICKGNRLRKQHVDSFLADNISVWRGDDRKRVKGYLTRSRFQRNSDYRKLVSCLPGPLPGQGLIDSFPELEEEWHGRKNHPLKPSQFAPRSSQMIWWKCSKGHEWKARIADRTANHGCPFCAGKRATSDNNLALSDPDIAATWHPEKNGVLTPEAVTPKSNRAVYWKCNQGHEWKATVEHRARGLGCPYCSGKRVSATNNLAAINPPLAREWHPTKNDKLTASGVTAGSKKSVWWVCDLGHEWQAAITNRNKGDGCPYCSGKRPSPQNNLLTANPAVAQQWHPTKNLPLSPALVTPGSKKKAWWVCSKGHEWQAVIQTRNNGIGCPYCSGRKTCADNCLENVRPEIAKQWHQKKNRNLIPSMFTEHSGKKVWWLCSRGHEWQARIYSRSNGSQCPECRRLKLEL